ncbi:hypothetical protein EV421DRAFT_1125273 [Armillaria borealis]|uniref:Secreted protein n=1 Tax=Armillaria borealis TaxID=47425 RepID=A0AA39J691_9AGAR|nr:hypothetical protein EV421DRAFT_1125273 [Armillaria borealis]
MCPFCWVWRSLVFTAPCGTALDSSVPILFDFSLHCSLQSCKARHVFHEPEEAHTTRTSRSISAHSEPEPKNSAGGRLALLELSKVCQSPSTGTKYPNSEEA